MKQRLETKKCLAKAELIVIQIHCMGGYVHGALIEKRNKLSRVIQSRGQ